MDESTMLIIGANGQLGTALRQNYPKAHTTDVSELDITNKKSVEAYDWSKIKIVVNAAAYTHVDGAETPKGRIASWRVNAEAISHLIHPIWRNNITFVHISSDYVFDGTIESHSEDEPFSPLSVYGASKAAGDLLASSVDKHYILRTSWVIGEGNNFVRTMMGLAEKNISPTVVHDQIGRLTFTSELVRAIDHLLTKEVPFGTYNVSNSGDPASWADITREIFKRLKRDDLTVTNTTTEDYFKDKKNIALRPLQSTLNLDKLTNTGFVSRDWQEDLENYVKGFKK